MSVQALQAVIDKRWPAAAIFFLPMMKRGLGPPITVSGINCVVRAKPIGAQYEFVENGQSLGVHAADFLIHTQLGAELDILERSVDLYIRGRRPRVPTSEYEIRFAARWPLFYSCFEFDVERGRLTHLYARGNIGVSWRASVWFNLQYTFAELDDAERFIVSRLLCFEIEKILPQPIHEEVTVQIEPASVLLNYPADAN